MRTRKYTHTPTVYYYYYVLPLQGAAAADKKEQHHAYEEDDEMYFYVLPPLHTNGFFDKKKTQKYKNEIKRKKDTKILDQIESRAFLFFGAIQIGNTCLGRAVFLCFFFKKKPG